MTLAAWIVWTSLSLTVYAYLGYPALLSLWIRLRAGPGRRELRDLADPELPSVSVILPVFNEAAHIERKLANTLALDYPRERLEVLFVSDGSTDGTVELLSAHADHRIGADSRIERDSRIEIVQLPVRSGKAAALNAGLAAARHEIVVFTDASIMLERDAVRKIVRGFADPQVGCVSGEDVIGGSGGEALYGRYELFIRRRESRLHSIVGASGCFYAQRRVLCAPFTPALAPDFLSVLRTVDQGFRATADPEARGQMTAVAGSGREFERKVRTLLRGMTALGAFTHLLNPLRFGMFSVALFSHKILRWLVPVFLLAALAGSAALAPASNFYLGLLAAQLAFYALAAAGLSPRLSAAAGLPGKVAAWFVVTNAAALVAWAKYLGGARQELWAPSERLR